MAMRAKASSYLNRISADRIGDNLRSHAARGCDLRHTNVAETAAGSRYVSMVLRRVVLLLLIALPLGADMWYGGNTSTYVSDDKQWHLVVERNTSSQVKLYRKGRFGIRHRVARVIGEGFVTDARVANDGTFVLLHPTTSGDDAIAIYRRDGTLVRRLALSDLMSERDVAQLPHSTTSIRWGTANRIEGDTLVLEVLAAKREEIPVSLTTGEILMQRHPFFPSPRVTWSGRDVDRCIDDFVPLTASETESHALDACLPDYPRVARLAHVSGWAIVEIGIDTNGNAGAPHLIRPLPFGIDVAVLNAVSTWRFRPVVRDGKPVPACGQVMFSFTLK